MGSGVRFSCVRVFHMRHRVQEVVMHVHTHVPNLIPHLRRSPAWKSRLKLSWLLQRLSRV